MGSDLLVVSSISSQQFQSTLPGWGATGAMGVERRHERISIHAPRMGSDSAGRWVDITTIPFQSTLPGWGATRSWNTQTRNISISIHAPRMGSDVSPIACKPPISNFNPRSPDGERQYDSNGVSRKSLFQSTLPGWGATDHLESKCQEPEISIHAPRMGSDRAPQHGGSHRGISIHAPRMGSDAARQDDVHGRAISIHAPRMGSDPQSYTIAPIPPISIHAPRMGSD